MKTHRCAALGCEEQLSPALLMCRAHWQHVPADLRAAVYRTWKTFRGGGPRLPYHVAVKSAVDAVARKICPRCRQPRTMNAGREWCGCVQDP